MKEIFPGVFKQEKELYTLNKTPGVKVYGEKLVKVSGKEYRQWNPFRSKPAAAILKGLKNFPIKPKSKVLYLGIAEGTTASHFSDIVCEKGIIIGIEISPKPFEKLLLLCDERENIIPIIADANNPEQYFEVMKEVGKVDVIYQDLAQRIQASIFLKNADLFLKPKGYGVYMVKARSIDVTEKPSQVFKKEVEKIEKAGYSVIEKLELNPFHEGHACLVIKKE